MFKYALKVSQTKIQCMDEINVCLEILTVYSSSLIGTVHLQIKKKLKGISFITLKII